MESWSENSFGLENSGVYTQKEILGQPALWLKIYDLVKNNMSSISSFLSEIFAIENLQIIIAGAGTSAFIGDVLEGPFQKNTGLSARAIPTTDLVTHPELYIKEGEATLLISFARSGNSPESLKAVELVEELSRKTFHLIITCNPHSDLISLKSGNNSFVFLMPPEANDKGLAMTGSFTGMLLTGLLISRISSMTDLEGQMQIMSKYGMKVLEKYAGNLKSIAELDFERAVFLGSGLFKGIASESLLKLQELTDGKIICKHDSFLGFRHGPKAVIDAHTLVVYLFSNDDYVHNYERDLVFSMGNGRKGLYSIGISEQEVSDLDLDSKITMTNGDQKLEEDLLVIPSVLPAQILGFYKSLNLGLDPDSPSDSGMITRVVEGVKLYHYKK